MKVPCMRCYALLHDIAASTLRSPGNEAHQGALRAAMAEQNQSVETCRERGLLRIQRAWMTGCNAQARLSFDVDM